MAPPRHLVLFVEGDGDFAAAPPLVGRLLDAHNARDALFVDDKPFMVGGYPQLQADLQKNWLKRLEAAKKRPSLGGVLLLLDGDVRPRKGQRFCPVEAARRLAEEARQTGGGAIYSVGIVVACREYESWLIAGVESLAGRTYPNNPHQGIKAGTTLPEGNLEESPRDAKDWLSKHMLRGYKPTQDQEPLTRMLDLEVIRRRGLRSFRRLEHTLEEIANAVRTGTPIATPGPPS